jgi:hypothetical protein
VRHLCANNRISRALLVFRFGTRFNSLLIQK